MIQVNSLSKSFNRFEALRNVNFRCREGTTFGLLGLNGAGKTTCLRILSTILKPSGGQALVCGMDVSQRPDDVRRNIGVLSSGANLYNRLTPKELAELFGTLHKLSRKQIQANMIEIVESLAMQDYVDRRLETFSTGMKHKTALMLAFLHHPPVLLLDEPTAGLDIPSSKTVRKFVTAFKQQHRAILLCSHNLFEIQELCDQIAIIHKGTLLATGTLEELRKMTGQQELEDIFIHLTEGQENAHSHNAGH